MLMMRNTRRTFLGAACVALLVVPGALRAQSADEFYKGKTISMVIGYPPGGSNDLYARAVARHIGKHIPGNPTVVPRNMPGGGSLVAANHIYNVAPKDGTVIGLVAATIPLDEQLGGSGIKFKAAEFNWIGRVAPAVNVTFTWHTAPVKTIKDALEKEAVLGATGVSSTVAIYPTVLNNVAGTKFKLVMGYEGSPAAMLAMERGEVHGHSTSLDGVQAAHPDWIKEKKIHFIVQYALTRHPDLPDVPTAVELAPNPDQAQVLRIVMNATEVGKSVLAPPEVPKERVEVLRKAFTAMVKDPEFKAELEKVNLELVPLSGDEIQKLVQEVGNVSPDVLTKVRAAYPKTN
jgi:tripartite-type tricarboxylate transporter receptor subunit TctC